MKRILHALAALWPERQEYHNTWLPDARNGLLRHAVVVLRVEHAMEELALCKEPKIQPANAPDADTGSQTNEEPNNRLNLTSRLAGRRITVPGSSEIASLPAKAHLRIRVFANLQMACAQIKALIGQRPLRIKANQRISELAKTNLLTRSQTPLNPGYSLAFAIITLFMCLTAAKQVSAQQAEPAAAVTADIKPLQIGDTIPEELWNLPLQVVNHPEGREMITLNDYRGKLIILDFWDVWCTSCIFSFPSVFEAADDAGDGVQIVPVTMNTHYNISRFFSRNAITRKLDMMSVVEAQSLKRYFEYRYIPHSAWLSPRGELLITTGSKEITTDNILGVLAGDAGTMPFKIDQDPNQSLYFDNASFPDNVELKQYALFAKGYIPGLPSSSRIRSVNGIQTGFAIFNKPIGAIIYTLVNRLCEGIAVEKRLIYKSDTTVYQELNYKSTKHLSESDFYTCELNLTDDVGSQVYLRMLDMINENTDYSCLIEQRRVRCLVLSLSGDGNLLRTKGGERKVVHQGDSYQLVNWPVSRLIKYLNTKPISGNIQVVDETAYEGAIDILLTLVTDLESCQKELERFGLHLTEEWRVLDFFVVEKRSS